MRFAPYSGQNQVATNVTIVHSYIHQSIDKNKPGVYYHQSDNELCIKFGDYRQ
jgi:hypothetical protein